MIELNEQQVDFLKEFLAYHFGDDKDVSKTDLAIAESIIRELNKE